MIGLRNLDAVRSQSFPTNKIHDFMANFAIYS